MSNHHECEKMNKDVPISIVKIDGKWYWIFWSENVSTAHGIGFCPYCGERLKEV